MKKNIKKDENNKRDEELYECYLKIFEVLDEYPAEIQFVAVARVQQHLFEHLNRAFPIPLVYCHEKPNGFSSVKPLVSHQSKNKHVVGEK